MIAADVRGGNQLSLNEALGWIGSRVDDIYGAEVGQLEDVWIDPGTGAPRWLLVKEARFGSHTRLIPSEDATAGAGRVFVPHEREVICESPALEAGAPLTRQVEAALRRHYSASGQGQGRPSTGRPQAPSWEPAARTREHQPEHGAPPPPPPAAGPIPAGGAVPSRWHRHRDPSGHAPPPTQSHPSPANPPAQPTAPLGRRPPATEPGAEQWPPPAAGYGAEPSGAGGGRGEAAPRPTPSEEALPVVHALDRPYYVELEIEGSLRIRGALTGIRLVPADDDPPRAAGPDL